MAPALCALGMHVQIWGRCELLVEEALRLLQLGMPVVIDHLGSFDVSRGVNDSVFQRFLNILGEGLTWVKLTPIRNSKQAPHYADVRPFHEAVMRRASDRVWGSDWRYIGLDLKPSVAELVDLFDTWVGDNSMRHKVFVSNPNTLFGAKYAGADAFFYPTCRF